MSAQSPQFDSHRFVKRLTQAGLSEEVAEILADEHTNPIVPDDVATRADIADVHAKLDALGSALGSDLDSVKARMASRADLERVDRKVDALRTEFDALRTKFDALESRLDSVEDRMATRVELEIVDSKVDALRAEVDALRSDLGIVRSEMATKEDLRREIAACEQRMQNALLQAKVSVIKWMITTMMVFSGIVIGAMTALR